jgi:hypothetical protein
MAKLIFSHAEILSNTGTALDPVQGIYGLVADSVEITLEPNTVSIEDNRELYESYTGRIVIRTIHTGFGATGAGSEILGSAYVSSNGVLPTEGKLKLHGKGNTSHDIVTDKVFIQGHQAFDNGRLETVLIAQSADVAGTTAISVDPA